MKVVKIDVGGHHPLIVPLMGRPRVLKKSEGEPIQGSREIDIELSKHDIVFLFQTLIRNGYVETKFIARN